jgi:hypothetical protein
VGSADGLAVANGVSMAGEEVSALAEGVGPTLDAVPHAGTISRNATAVVSTRLTPRTIASVTADTLRRVAARLIRYDDEQTGVGCVHFDPCDSASAWRSATSLTGCITPGQDALHAQNRRLSVSRSDS